MKIKLLIPKPRLVPSTPQATRSSLIQELKPRLVKLLLSNPAHPVPRDTEMNAWEYRHGAALSLISVLKVQGSGAAKSVGTTRTRNSEQHQLWMEDICLRLICLLSLDQFGDYVGDQVITPVRETAAQAISLVGRWLDRSGVQHMLSIFHQMVEKKNVYSNPPRGYAWQVRHAGLLQMKYLVAFKNDMLCPNDDVKETNPSVALNPDSMDDVDVKPAVKLEAHSESVDSGKQHVSDGESTPSSPCL
ncbi:hypothetical protein PCANC_23711 [Puccinia coronata f. sp. avenae]|uniref:Uncharacterized protein n=1 Tax=Puccinia coronata f. sp. avenae TaxID=200324 RepID=A0A2N5UDB7_9BASI|nr:hypothetical protein PCANC_23711 [Puccinia coronata f. sp. avenae]